jgi:D-alanine-D-alanine ligase
MGTKTRVAAVYGGRSGEHEVSLRSAESVIDAMDPERYEVRRFLIRKDGTWDPGPILPTPGAHPDIDVIFPVLHGTFGEDGTVQGLFELADLPYVGAGVLASSVSMDKEMMKRLFAAANLPVAEWVTVYRGDRGVNRIEAALQYPMFVKPANLGSSVGISKAHDRDELVNALALAAEFDSKIIVEETIVGRELEIAVLGNRNPTVSLPCEIFPSREFYDYEDKYLLDQARFDLPAKMSAEMLQQMQRLAAACYSVVGCTGLARVDFLFDNRRNKLFINEINTMPGFTSISMYPKMMEQIGIAYPQLVERLIELAFERHAEKKATRFSR